MNEKKLILIILLACIIGRMIVTPVPINEDITTGADQSAYLMRAQILKDQGQIDWNTHWYAGYPFMTFYPPLSFYLISWFSELVSMIISFKFLTFIAFALTPLAFYYFLKEFKLTVKQMLVATIIFSFTMYYNMFIFLGQLPSILAILFALIFLKFFIKGVNTGNKKYLFVSGILFTLTLLTQQIVSFMACFISLIYALSYGYFEESTTKLKRAFIVWVPAILMSSFWLIPTFIESEYTSTHLFYGGIRESFLYSIPATGVIDLFGGVYINLFTVVLSILGGILILIGLIYFARIRKESAEPLFWIWLTILFLAGYFIAYSLFWGVTPFPPPRFVILWAIPFSVLIAKAFDRANFWNLLIGIFIAMQLILFFGMSMPMQTQADYTKFDPAFQFLQGREGRFSFQPQGAPYNKATVSHYRPVIYQLENELGIFGIALPANRMEYMYNNFAFNCIEPIPLTQRIQSLDFLTRHYIPEKDCERTDSELEGYFYLQNVHYIIADKDYPNVVNYFENKSSEYLNLLDTDDFVIYEFLRNPPYVEAGADIDYSYTKGPGWIWINLTSDVPLQNVDVRVSESWYAYWTSEDVELSSDENGFITFTLDEVHGTKEIILEYKKPDYYGYLWIVSGIGIMLLILPFTRRSFHSKRYEY